jgi:NAD(P)-dependent dehydrogenase (short-subunit alcohol dehydrogenase family)
VVALLQAAASSGISGVQVNVLTSGVQANPLAAMIPGLMRVAAREYPAIGCRAIDLAGGDFPVAAIANELRASFETPVVALRERRRLERTYQQAQPSADQAPVLRKNGVYLITGGLGGVGLALAEHLATEYGARLVLSSRNGLPTTAHDEETRQRMKILERVRQAAGGLLIQTADIGDPEQARELVQSTIREFGRLDGVIHAAGVMGGGALQRRPDEAAQAILHAKVRGTLALEAALEGVPHDFLFLCSSLSAVGSTYGQGDYTAANAFLDAYAEHANTKQRRVISVNWDGWADVGSHARYVAEKPVAHPLLNEWEAETRGGAYRTDLHPDHWIVAEHRVAGERMVPGTTYVELACAIAKTRGWEFPITIPELTLASPCTSQALYTSIQETAQGMTLRMESRNQRGEWQLHALARVEPGSTAQQETDSQMAATAVGQTHAVQPAERRGLIEFGPRWACPSWKSGSTGAYKLPEAYAAEAADFVLHPALFDMLSGVAKPEEDGAYLPFSYTDIVVHGPLGADVLVKATSSSRSQDALHVGMRITDPSGRILVTIGDYMLRLMQVAVGSAN